MNETLVASSSPFMTDPPMVGVLIFMYIALVGISIVSMHYRKEYEQKKIQNKKLKDIIYKYEDINYSQKKPIATPDERLTNKTIDQNSQ